MKYQDNLSEAIATFSKQLPDPRLTSTSTIASEIVVRGKKTRLIAQKVKGITGLTWKVEPIEVNFLERVYY